MKPRKNRKLPLCASAESSPFVIEAAAEFGALEAKQGEAPARPTFSIVAYSGDKMRPGGWGRDVVIDLKGLTSNKTLPILLDHDPSQIVGQANNVEIGDKSVKLTGVVTGDHATLGDPAHKVVSHAKGGFSWAASVGVSPSKTEFIGENQSANVNGRQFNGPLVIVREGRLGETSFVAIGADKTASAKVAATAKSKEEIAMNEFEKWLKANEIEGFDAMSKKAQAKLKAAFDAEQGGDGDDEDDAAAVKTVKKVKASGSRALADKVAATKARNERAEKIGEIAARWIDERPEQVEEINAAAEAAIEANENPSDFELAMLRAMRANFGIGKGQHGGRNDVTDPNVLAAALCIHGGLSEDVLCDKKLGFKEETLNAAQKRWKGGISLGEFLQACANSNGFRDLSVRNPAALLKGAFAVGLRAGFSSLDIDGILSNAGNKFLIASYMAVENAWQQISAIRPVKDFKQITSYRMTGANKYDKVGPGGELKHGTLAETSYTNQADTYGKILAITRQDIINDDLGAFVQLMKILGRGGALKFNDVFWTAFMADAGTFWTTGRGNYTSGATTALSPDSMKVATKLFKKLVDDDSTPMGHSPRILLVPVDIETDAQILMNSMENRQNPETSSGTATKTTYGTNNVFKGRYNVVSSTYLSNTSFTGYSTTAWYLLADPNDVPVIESCFLNGQQSPTIESADADFNTLGIQMRAYHDFGVNKQEYRGGVKIAGA